MPRPLPPVTHRIVVPLAPADAFELFTQGIARWWPFAGHSCTGEDAREVQFEACVGGAVTEVDRHAQRHPWGSLTAWSPPLHFAMSWHPAQPADTATALAVWFTAVAAGCELRLEHGGWDARGEEAPATRGSYEAGWALVLGHYTQASRKGTLP